MNSPNRARKDIHGWLICSRCDRLARWSIAIPPEPLIWTESCSEHLDAVLTAFYPETRREAGLQLYETRAVQRARSGVPVDFEGPAEPAVYRLRPVLVSFQGPREKA